MAFSKRTKDDVVAGRRLRVELICRALQAAPSTYYAANGRPASARHVQDVEVAPQLHTIWESNYSVYGVRKLWKAARRAIIGWRCASNMTTETVLDAIEMARWSRGSHLPELRCHSDAGSQFTSIRYGERLTEIGATPSIRTVGDSYDNALAETVNRYDKAELIRGPTKSGPCKTVDKLELATLGRVHWHTTRRLHSYLGDVPPAEFKKSFYAGITSAKKLVDTTFAESPPNPKHFTPQACERTEHHQDHRWSRNGSPFP